MVVKKKNIIKEKSDKNIKKKLILILLFLLILLTFIELKGKEEINKYNDIKIKEINKMANFLNHKYNMKLRESDCIYYLEQDYDVHSDFLGNSYKEKIPYIAVFKNKNNKITAVDRNGIVSDNNQLKDLNDMLINYYEQKTGIKFDFIDFGREHLHGKDNVINVVIENKFNQLITEQNIEQFINYILQESDLSITFYINVNNKNNIETITEKLEYLRDYSNIQRVSVYGYDKEPVIKHYEMKFDGTQIEDLSIGYEFGYYYIDYYDRNNNIFSLTMNLNSNYTSEIDESINGWEYREFN